MFIVLYLEEEPIRIQMVKLLYQVLTLEQTCLSQTWLETPRQVFSRRDIFCKFTQQCACSCTMRGFGFTKRFIMAESGTCNMVGVLLLLMSIE